MSNLKYLHLLIAGWRIHHWLQHSYNNPSLQLRNICYIMIVTNYSCIGGDCFKGWKLCNEKLPWNIYKVYQLYNIIHILRWEVNFNFQSCTWGHLVLETSSNTLTKSNKFPSSQKPISAATSKGCHEKNVEPVYWILTQVILLSYSWKTLGFLLCIAALTVV